MITETAAEAGREVAAPPSKPEAARRLRAAAASDREGAARDGRGGAPARPASAPATPHLRDGFRRRRGTSARCARAKAPPSKAKKDDAATSAGRFVVQVGAFADAATAREARQKVEKLGLKTYTQVVETSRRQAHPRARRPVRVARRGRQGGRQGQVRRVCRPRCCRCEALPRSGWVDLALARRAGAVDPRRVCARLRVRGAVAARLGRGLLRGAVASRPTWPPSCRSARRARPLNHAARPSCSSSSRVADRVGARVAPGATADQGDAARHASTACSAPASALLRGVVVLLARRDAW